RTPYRKIVLSLEEPNPPVAAPPDDRVAFPAEATYLITGGLGGFRLATAAWMVEHGARHLGLRGRRGATSGPAEQAVEALRQAGATVRVARADVADAQELGRVLADVRRELPPLRGVLHAAMVLDDCPIRDLTPARLQAVLAPQIEGAWNLH